MNYPKLNYRKLLDLFHTAQIVSREVLLFLEGFGIAVDRSKIINPHKELVHGERITDEVLKTRLAYKMANCLIGAID